MKKVCFTVVSGLMLAAFAYSQSPRVRKPIEVTPQMIASQRTGKPYVIDLTRKRNTYVVTAKFANRVRIRTSKGEMVMTDLMRKLKLSSNKFVVGTLADFLPPNFIGTRTANIRAFKCDGDVCTCNPIVPNDCWQMNFDCDTTMVCVNPCVGPECSAEEANRLLYCWCEQIRPD